MADTVQFELVAPERAESCHDAHLAAVAAEANLALVQPRERPAREHTLDDSIEVGALLFEERRDVRPLFEAPGHLFDCGADITRLRQHLHNVTSNLHRALLR